MIGIEESIARTALPDRALRAVAFDMDGLLLNTEHIFARAATGMVTARGLAMPDDLLRRMMGRRPPEGFRIMKELLGVADSIEQLAEEAHTRFFALLDEQLQTMPGALELLDELDTRGIPKAIATSSPRAYLERFLGQLKMLERFDFALTAEDVSNGKPHPEIYLSAAARHGIAPDEMLVFEDSEAGTNAAAAANAFIVSVPHEFSRRHNFENARAIVNSLQDPAIRAILDAHRGA